MSRSKRQRVAGALATTVLTAIAVPTLGAVPASANDGGGCQSAVVQYRVVDADGNPVGGDWTSIGNFQRWKDAPTIVQVRLAAGKEIGEGCKYAVSLAAYKAEGATWKTSGQQSFVASSTVYLGKQDVAGSGDENHTWQKLTVPAPDCYGQIDLYGNDVVYDGQKDRAGHGDLPHYPDTVTPKALIAAWNGGDKTCTGTSTPPTPPAPSTSAPSSPSSSSPSSSPSKPAPSSSETTPAATPSTPVSTAPPSTNPTVSPVPSSSTTLVSSASPSPSPSGPTLAETGSSAPLGLIAGGGALVIIAGGAVLFGLRGRTRRH